MHHEAKLVGYRTLLPDLYFDQKGVPQRFAWLSGNWVHPGMRRKGISSTLLAEAEKLWNGCLMYTNYAPDSKALYDQTGRFQVIARREGRRYYLRSNSEELLGNRMNAKGLLRISDSLINQVRERELRRFSIPENPSISVERIRETSPELDMLISRIQQHALFRRDAVIFTWALNHPWVTDSDVPELNYHFSFRAGKFENILYDFRHAESGARGLLWLIHHNNSMSVPYLFCEEKELSAAMAACLTREMIDRGCTHTTIRNPELNTRLETFRKRYLSSRQMPQFIFAHTALTASVPSGRLIHDGDGDVMFTG